MSTVVNTFAKVYAAALKVAKPRAAKVAALVAQTTDERKAAKRADAILANPSGSSPEAIFEAAQVRAAAKKAAKGYASQARDAAADVAEDSAVLIAQNLALYAAMSADAAAIDLQTQADAAKVAADAYRADARALGVRNVSRKRAAEAKRAALAHLASEGVEPF